MNAKRDFIECFNGKMIYECPFPMTFHLTETAKASRIDNFISYIDSQYDNYALIHFILDNKEVFFTNTVSKTTLGSDGKVVRPGAKLIKSFKHFVDGKTALYDLQNRASQIIQEDTITGTLCFSVHPLDYLSSSENAYNWRSCHALDGEYRAGNLSYMCDKSTVVCYLRGEKSVKLPMFPEDVLWNNKKWRVLLHFNESWDLIFSGRQYPFSTSCGMDIVRKWLLHALKKDSQEPNWCDWTDPVLTEVKDSYGHEYDLNNCYVALRGYLHNIRNVVKDAQPTLHFNDVLRSSVYTPHYIAFNNRPWVRDEYKEVNVGSACTCLKCGTAPITSNESFMCCDCDLEYGYFDEEIYTICDCCGRRIYREDAFIVDDDEVCEDCVKTECFYCENCEEIHYNNYREYIESRDMYVCTYCAEHMEI